MRPTLALLVVALALASGCGDDKSTVNTSSTAPSRQPAGIGGGGSATGRPGTGAIPPSVKTQARAIRKAIAKCDGGFSQVMHVNQSDYIVVCKNGKVIPVVVPFQVDNSGGSGIG